MMTRRFAPSVLVVLLAACSASDAVHPASTDARAAARPDGFRLVLLRADAPPQPGDAGAPLVRTIEEAVARVAPGGTIRVSPGEYAAESVLIDKPVIIEGVGSSKPVISTAASLEGLHLQHPEGTVTIRNIEFHNDFAGVTRDDAFVFSYSVRASDRYANLLIEDSDFIMRTGGHASGIFYSGGAIPGNGHLVVRRSRFIGGRAAIGATGREAGLEASKVEIYENQFIGQRPADPVATNFAVQVRSPDVTIRNNTFRDCGDRCVNVAGGFAVVDNVMTDCGATYCVEAFGGPTSSGVIARNRMSNALSAGFDSFFHHVILLFNAHAIVEDNEIDGCGYGQCITAVARASGEIRNNRITAHHGQNTRIAIVLSDNSGGESPRTDLGASMRVYGNVIVGAGGMQEADRDNEHSYAFNIAAFVNEGHSALVAEQNTVRGANYGFITRTGSVTEGSGNQLSDVRVGVGAFANAASTQLHWNDIAAFRSFDIPDGGEVLTDITCNWWGSEDGPANYFGAPAASVYTPWAIAPVADAGTGDCTGGAAKKKAGSGAKVEVKDIP